MPFKSTFESGNATIGTHGRFEGKSNNAKPPARTDFAVIEDGNNKTKDRFLPSRNSLFIAAKATQNSRQTFHYFPPTVWKYGKRKSCHDFFFPSFYQKSHFFFFPSPELTNDWVWFLWCLEQRTDSAKKRAWMGDSLQEIVKLLRKHRPPQQAVFTTLAYLNMMKILSALLITSSLNRTELFITNATSDHKYTKQKHATLIS